MEEPWDFLIVLDACRFDAFNYVYGDYLEGELEKVISVGSSTIEWCKNAFQKQYGTHTWMWTLSKRRWVFLLNSYLHPKERDFSAQWLHSYLFLKILC